MSLFLWTDVFYFIDGVKTSVWLSRKNTLKNKFTLSIHFNIARAVKSRRLSWAGHLARMEEGRSAFKISTGKTTGKRSLRRPRFR